MKTPPCGTCWNLDWENTSPSLFAKQNFRDCFYYDIFFYKASSKLIVELQVE